MVTRRDLAKTATALAGFGALMRERPLRASTQLVSPDSVMAGVTIGVNAPYSFGSEATDAMGVLRALRQVGLSSIELRADVAELFAGAPASAARGGGAGRAGRGRGGGNMELASWRVAAPMERFEALRHEYETAGVSIDAFRFTFTAAMPDDECDYAFRAAKSLGAGQVTLELPGDLDLTRRIGAFGTRHQLPVGYHLHTTASMTAWDAALAQSRFNQAQVDVGHYVAGTGESPIPLLRKHASQIASLHLKDRRTPANGAANMSWGQGDTPLREILHFMRGERATYPAFIELEHMTQLPDGASRTLEVYKCVEYCRSVLAE